MIVESEYLYNNEGNHDKVYNLNIHESTALNPRYRVIAEYGARLGVLKSITKLETQYAHLAHQKFQELINDKIKKGYRPVTQNMNTRSRPKPSETTKPVLKKLTKPAIVKPLVIELELERRLDIDL